MTFEMDDNDGLMMAMAMVMMAMVMMGMMMMAMMRMPNFASEWDLVHSFPHSLSHVLISWQVSAINKFYVLD